MPVSRPKGRGNTIRFKSSCKLEIVNENEENNFDLAYNLNSSVRQSANSINVGHAHNHNKIEINVDYTES